MTEETDANSRKRWLFVATILTGSFLLFLVQPLVARMALPRLGGAPTVWNSAMLVYQALLLGGYAYAHALARFSLRRQAIIHLALLVLAGLTLPIALADLAPSASGWEALWVPLLFLATIGPVFFVVSAQAPLIQRWYAADPESGDPYWLYAASNLGSFSGLIAYPLLLEPTLPLARQSLAWSVGYGLLVLLVALAAASRWRARDAGSQSDAGEAIDDAPEVIGGKRIALWLALAAVPSGLMLSTTTHLTTDIVAMPLLWVIPLGLYLLSFVFAFNERSVVGHILARVAPIVVLLAGSMAMVSHGAQAVSIGLATVIMLFVVAVALHRRLYQDRPPPSQLTFFYLVMSAGGALGGLFTALVAPVLFDWVWEHPLLVLAAVALLPSRHGFDWMGRLGIPENKRRAAILVVLVLALFLSGQLHRAVLGQNDYLVLALVVAVAALGVLLLNRKLALVVVMLALMLGRGGYYTLGATLDTERQRSFFGIYAVRDYGPDDRTDLTHGTTLHGMQYNDPARRLDPTTYYGNTSGVGLVLDAANNVVGDDARVGVVGLGVGTLACYRQPGQKWDFFEIDPLVVEYSRDGTFTFISECSPDAAMHIGDARIELAKFSPGTFDALVIDAFSSDAIPLHLVTTEAFAMYRQMLSQDGILLVHISNRHVELSPMIAALAQENGLAALMRRDEISEERGTTPSLWVALSPDPARLAQLEAASGEHAWTAPPEPAKRVWTDDFASILPFLKWGSLVRI